SILSHESYDSNFEDNPLISRPPPESPDDNFDLEPEVISAVMEDIDEPDEHFNLGGEIFASTNNEDVDTFLSFEFSCHISSFLRFFLYSSSLRARIQSLTLDYPPMVEAFLCKIYVQFSRPSYPLINFSLGNSISMIYIAYSLFVLPLCSKF
nr:hypothetical protein [Tanacetum cinerariifolium]